MRAWCATAVGVTVVALAVGCSTGDSDVALPTDGPNQVVLKVPGMT